MLFYLILSLIYKSCGSIFFGVENSNPFKCSFALQSVGYFYRNSDSHSSSLVSNLTKNINMDITY